MWALVLLALLGRIDYNIKPVVLHCDQIIVYDVYNKDFSKKYHREICLITVEEGMIGRVFVDDDKTPVHNRYRFFQKITGEWFEIRGLHTTYLKGNCNSVKAFRTEKYVFTLKESGI